MQNGCPIQLHPFRSCLAVCSCTILPVLRYLSKGGIGPAIAFLYSGPAINVSAIMLTARVRQGMGAASKEHCCSLFAIMQ